MSIQSLKSDSSRKSSLRRWVGKAAQVARVITGRQSAARGLTVYPNDVYIVFYPRSGNNWLRFLIGNLIDPPQSSHVCQSRGACPGDLLPLRPSSAPVGHVSRSAKSRGIRPTLSGGDLSCTNPRDVAVSNYPHNLAAGNIPEGYALDEFVARFIDGRFDRKWGPGATMY